MMNVYGIIIYFTLFILNTAILIKWKNYRITVAFTQHIYGLYTAFIRPYNGRKKAVYRPYIDRI